MTGKRTWGSRRGASPLCNTGLASSTSSGDQLSLIELSTVTKVNWDFFFSPGNYFKNLIALKLLRIIAIWQQFYRKELLRIRSVLGQRHKQIRAALSGHSPGP